MKTMSLQFHATIEDIYEFIIGVKDIQSYRICGITYFPNFTIENVEENMDVTDIKKYDYIVISKNRIPSAKNNYEFMKLQNNNLIIDIGTNNSEGIKESVISVFSETEIDSDWRKLLNNYKKSLLRGAWVLNPGTNAKSYYKNHKYTVNAKKAYESGVKICPIAGWNIYELTNEQDM
ncbi:MAG: hypothetical protein IKK33_16950 [Lachnospiraceae bacterium]|nr:hypothetical protein [Lachnospiraceae bacterium]